MPESENKRKARGGDATPPADAAAEKQEPGLSNRLKTAPHLLRVLRPYGGVLLFCLVLSMLQSSLGLVKTFLLRYIIDIFTASLPDDQNPIKILGLSQLEFLWWLMGIGVAALLAAQSLGYLNALLMGKVSNSVVTQYRNWLDAHIQQLPLPVMDGMKIGGMTARIMTDPNQLNALAGQGLVQTISAGFTFGIATVILFWLNFDLGLLSVLCLPLMVVSGRQIMKRLRPMWRTYREANQEVSARLAESLSGARVVKVYRQEPDEAAVFKTASDDLLDRTIRILKIELNLGFLIGLLSGGILLVILFFSGLKLMHGLMTPGEVTQFFMILLMMLMPVVTMVHFLSNLQGGLAAVDRIDEVLSQESEYADRDKVEAQPVRGDVVFENVSFRYADNGSWVLDDISFAALSGSVTAVVGPSGAGKSTLVHLVARFYAPVKGRIRLDGRDLKDWPLSALRSSIGMVLQETFLFDGTIRENVAFSRKQASEEEIRAALGRAQCMEFVNAYETGIDTRVGERGVKLSGGQKQRLAIARAILADPKILILDEATSSLDSASELAIQKGMQDLIRNRTTFVIAHRLTTVRHADRILVLDQGRIDERGTHAELMAKGGIYAEMIRAQTIQQTDGLRGLIN